MNFSTLITQFDHYNHISVLLCKKYKVKEVVFLYKKDDYSNLKNFIKDNEVLNKLKISTEEVTEDKSNSILEIINKFKNNEVIINLTGGERIISLMLMNICNSLNINSVYVDLLNKKRYVFSEDFRVINQGLEDLTLKDLVAFTGGHISVESTELCNREDIKEFTLEILKNLPLWHKYKQRLYDNSIFKHDYKDTSSILINTRNIKDDEKDILYKLLNYLKNKGEINYTNEEEIKVEFKNHYLKSFIFKSGTWLEVLTNMVVSEIKEVDEVKSGVIFYWGRNSERIRNEIDVVAVKDSVLICISCKDSDKYNEEALNELQVYSNRLGGKDTIKILVATKEPFKRTVMDRAKEMGINLVVIDRDINIFKNKIKNIVEEIKKI